MARSYLDPSSMADDEQRPTPALVEYLVSSDIILIIGGALPQQLSISAPEDNPAIALSRLAEAAGLPSTSPTRLFSVLEWAIEQLGRPRVVSHLAEFLSAKKRWTSTPALDGLLSAPPRLILTTWFDSRLLRLLRSTPQAKNRVIWNDTNLSSLQNSDARAPIFTLLGTLDQPSSLILNEASYNRRLLSTGYFHSYCGSMLATSTWLFLGFEQAPGFELHDLYQRLCDMVPKRAVRDYAFFSEEPDPVAALRLNNAGLSIIRCLDLVAFLNRLSAELFIARQRRQDQLQMSLMPPGQPYKYLDSYSEIDGELFRGRTGDVAELSGCIVGSEAVVLYGNSGVGKTSLLEAGIHPKLRQQGIEFVRTRVLPDPARGICSALDLPLPEEQSSGRWLSLLRAEMKKRKRSTVVIAFDQFEELFSELPLTIQRDFWDDVGRARLDKTIRIQFVFSIRQESLYLIKNAFPAIPKPYAVMYSLERLTRAQQKEVVEMPARIAGRAWSVEFVERLLDDISVYPAETGHLSIVLTTLWKSRNDNSDISNYELLGGVAGILKNYLWDVVDRMRCKELVRSVLKAFVSPEKRKSQITIEDLVADLRKSSPPVPRDQLQSICGELVNLRLLRQAHGSSELTFELSHDLLADAIAETINKEELEDKYAKRVIRAANQSFRATKRLPGSQEFERLAGYGPRVALLPDDLTFLALCAANLGRNPDCWLVEALKVGGDLKKFLSMCIASGSVHPLHEVMYRASADNYEKWEQELTAVGQVDRPSIRRHFRDIVNSLPSSNARLALAALIKELPSEIVIPAGQYVFGIANAGELSVRESAVWTNEFAIDPFPVTNVEYQEFVKATHHACPRHWEGGRIPYGQDYAPVTYVSWFDAASYAIWKGKRLPTEAEWERAGYWEEETGKKRLYPWGDAFDKTLANYFDSNIGLPSPIGQFSPQGDSAYGVSDMAGNVYEWVLDDAVEPFQGFQSNRNPMNKLGPRQQFKMARGGSYGGPAEQLQCGYRQYARAATTRDAYVGFRCVASTLAEPMDYMTSSLEMAKE